MSNKLLDKLLKNTTINLTSTLLESKIYKKSDMTLTDVPMINVALSGSVNGGMSPGLLVIAGPSKHFKTAFTMLLGAAYLKKYKDAVMLFYNSEFGTPPAYFDSMNIDKDRVVHTPITNIEQLKFDIVAQLEEISANDKVIVVIDSIGNLASKKEVEDAGEQKSVADMSRAKAFKSFWRIVTPHLALKDIPCVAVNHTYQTMELYSRAVVSGGTGIYYSANDIWIVGRQQEKEGTEVVGWNFVINIEKSRYVKEKSKIPITVTHEGGIKRWSGLFDVALEGGYIAKPSQGWYQTVDRQTGELVGDKMREKDFADDRDFWLKMFKETDFTKYIENTYKLATNQLVDTSK